MNSLSRVFFPFTIAACLLLSVVVFGYLSGDDEERMLWFIRKCEQRGMAKHVYLFSGDNCSVYENISCDGIWNQTGEYVACEEDLEVDLKYLQQCTHDCNPKLICKPPEVAQCENETTYRPTYNKKCADERYGSSDDCNFFYVCPIGHPRYHDRPNACNKKRDDNEKEYSYIQLEEAVKPSIIYNLTDEENDLCRSYYEINPNGTDCRYEYCDKIVNCTELGTGRFPNPGSCSHYCVCGDTGANDTLSGEAYSKECAYGLLFDPQFGQCVPPNKFGCFEELKAT